MQIFVKCFVSKCIPVEVDVNDLVGSILEALAIKTGGHRVDYQLIFCWQASKANLDVEATGV